MAILKCKMCGGDIQAADGAAYGTCESCGTTSTLPKASEEKTVNLFNRANHFRRLNDFDKALSAYESILNEDNTNAEAHWCAVLCRFGIEYVEDPRTHERIPTCRRVQFESVLSDPDYLAALEYAGDEYTKSLYEDEAKKIGEIQKGILAISNKEEPYDVFICYKETTDGGSRTKDSTIAQDIYYELTKDGYKVFFAKITLEDKLGQEYEPYIFSALNSAKVMLVIGTCKEHFEAVWVKNEWSRFLAIMKKDRSRLLIPCYRDMDAYDIPDELSNLQSQDMSKVGFIQDILRGVKKVLDASKSSEKTSSATAAGTAAAPGVESLMKRGHLFLEDSDWKQANEYFDKVLDIDPEYAPAYVGKLCAELKVRQEEQLGENEKPISELGNFQKAVRFTNVDHQVKLKGYDEKIRERLRQEHYKSLVQQKNEASTEKIYQDLAKQFRAMNGYKNTTKLASECDNQYSILKERREEQERIERERRAEQDKKNREEQEQRRIENEKEQERQRIERKKKQQERILLGIILGLISGVVIVGILWQLAPLFNDGGPSGAGAGFIYLFIIIGLGIFGVKLLRGIKGFLVGGVIGFVILVLIIGATMALSKASGITIVIVICGTAVVGAIIGGLIGRRINKKYYD